MKLASDDGSGSRYCYGDKTQLERTGKLVCLECGRFIPLECSRIDAFLEHIYEDHGFEPDRKHLILYGCCADCKANKE